MNPHNCYKIIDAFTFLLTLEDSDLAILEKAHHPIGLLNRMPDNEKFIKENNR